MLAARFRLGAHNVRIYNEGERRAVELHLEMDESLDLEEAHRQATQFENELQKAVPGLARVDTHLEPRGDGTSTRRAEPAGQRNIEAALAEFLRAHKIAAHPHDVRVKEVGGELAVSLHFTLDGATSIAEAHQLTEQLEAHLRQRVPNVGRVVIHPEPQ
jgi:divalent metal cation (Fe/Co/Zn/Cd) transporter